MAPERFPMQHAGVGPRHGATLSLNQITRDRSSSHSRPYNGPVRGSNWTLPRWSDPGYLADSDRSSAPSSLIGAISEDSYNVVSTGSDPGYAPDGDRSTNSPKKGFESELDIGQKPLASSLHQTEDDANAISAAFCVLPSSDSFSIISSPVPNQSDSQRNTTPAEGRFISSVKQDQNVSRSSSIQVRVPLLNVRPHARSELPRLHRCLARDGQATRCELQWPVDGLTQENLLEHDQDYVRLRKPREPKEVHDPCLHRLLSNHTVASAVEREEERAAREEQPRKKSSIFRRLATPKQQSSADKATIKRQGSFARIREQVGKLEVPSKIKQLVGKKRRHTEIEDEDVEAEQDSPPQKAPKLERVFAPGYEAVCAECHEYINGLEECLEYPYMEFPMQHVSTAPNLTNVLRQPPYQHDETLAILEGRPFPNTLEKQLAQFRSWVGFNEETLRRQMPYRAPDLRLHPAFRRDSLTPGCVHYFSWAGEDVTEFRHYVRAAEMDFWPCDATLAYF